MLTEESNCTGNCQPRASLEVADGIHTRWVMPMGPCLVILSLALSFARARALSLSLSLALSLSLFLSLSLSLSLSRSLSFSLSDTHSLALTREHTYTQSMPAHASPNHFPPAQTYMIVIQMWRQSRPTGTHARNTHICTYVCSKSHPNVERGELAPEFGARGHGRVATIGHALPQHCSLWR